ncbi:MAG: heterodisulfide reductase-related iron-sulfur binding cluster [Candidatus Aminicenantes bacterium]|nr:heterodisulfide reductase-related iron-sulfur binding cluster [Candidatus Aminicenantes bacterium]
MLSLIEKIIFTLLIIVTIFAFFYPVSQKYRIIRLSRPVRERTTNLGRRFLRMFSRVLFQRCSLRNERIITGIIHAGFFYAALTFDTMTLNHTLEGFSRNFSLFGHGVVRTIVSFMIDFMALIVLMATFYFMIRRFVFKPKGLLTTSLDSIIIYIFLLSTTLSYLFFEACGATIHPEETRLSFLGPFLSGLLFDQNLPSSNLTLLYRFSWWLHIIIVYAFIAYVPHSKYFHMFAGPINLIFHRQESPGVIEPLDLEKEEIFGLEKASDLTWKDCLDAFACIECGRCQDVCPAFISAKPLSPKMIIFNLEKHLLSFYPVIKRREKDKLPSLIPTVIKPEEIWTCTSCAACMHVCPVEIEHLPKIFGLRQNKVLMEGNFPPELNNFFRNLETNANPWGIGFTQRTEWAEKEKVPLITDHPEAEILLFVGCAGSFDDRGQGIVKAVVKILRHAKVNFAILGEEEKCCGDAARRLGNEYLFQMLARYNLETFIRYKIKKILIFCPHGYHTLKYEYPKLLRIFTDIPEKEKESLAQIEVISHLEFFVSLLQKGKIKLNGQDSKVTLHDSCYFARHHGLIKEPRELLKHIPRLSIEELPRSKDHSFCCGAGGGLMWTEEKIGERINRLRAQEIASTRAKTVVTTCPFCLTMIHDGLKDLGREDIHLYEISQLIANLLS